MASGFIEGIYDEDEISFNLPKICEGSGVEFIEDIVKEIDPKEKKVRLKSGITLCFDVLSLDIGSEVAGKEIEGVDEYATIIKPLTSLTSIKEKLEMEWYENFHVVIAGAGAAGVEIGLEIRSFSENAGKDLKISIVNSSNSILKDYAGDVRERALETLGSNKFEVYLDKRIISVDSNTVIIDNHKKLSFDMLIWACGAAANPMIAKAGFKTDGKGYLSVNKYLQSLDYPYVFGAGDCIDFEDFDYVKK